MTLRVRVSPQAPVINIVEIEKQLIEAMGEDPPDLTLAELLATELLELAGRKNLSQNVGLVEMALELGGVELEELDD